MAATPLGVLAARLALRVVLVEIVRAGLALVVRVVLAAQQVLLAGLAQVVPPVVQVRRGLSGHMSQVIQT
jgi:hypothetical protein